MTPQQLKAAILADNDPAIVQARTDRVDSEIARLYNLPAAPVYWIWRTAVPWDEILQNGFDFLRVDNLSIGKARVWEWLFKNQANAIDPRKANIRQGVIEAWKGTQADLDVRAQVWLHCQRQASKVERLFATGAGTAATIDGVGPGVSTVTAPLTTAAVSAALNLE
jgi:hypothetical protein